MAKIEKFEDIEAWKQARVVTNAIYDATSLETFAKDFALVNQIRRAAISLVSNIAEGFERNGDKEFVQFLAVAKGSCAEVRSQLYIALDRGYVGKSEFDRVQDQLKEISRLIAGLIRYLRQSELKGSKFK